MVLGQFHPEAKNHPSCEDLQLHLARENGGHRNAHFYKTHHNSLQLNLYMVSFENSFTQKVLLFLFTWGSASSRFHLEVPARIHLPSAKDSFSCKGI